ncbi:MAG: response regulator transcription factor [bacterium]|nr:response regulator transcription factor [bacterium]
MDKLKKPEIKIIKILIVDDHPLVRQGMKKIIEKEDDMQVCGETNEANEAISLISKLEPHCVIADISLDGETNGIDLVKAVRERFTNTISLVLSMHDESVYAERAIRAGARGYVTKKEAPSKVVEAIRTIVKGNLFLSSKVSGKIIDKLIHGSADVIGTPVDKLSDREFEVFQLIGNGFGTGEIAKKLNLSVNTIESHRKKIKEKLGIESGSQLIKDAVQWTISQNK